MIRKALFAGALVTTLLVAAPARAQENKPQYTVAEYNAFQACANDASPASKLACLANFEKTYPQSTLLPFVYSAGLQAAGASSNWAKIIEYADKVTSLGDKVDVPNRFNACFNRANAFHRVFNPRAANATEMATQARDSADACLALGAQMTKPEQATQKQFDDYMTGAKTLLNYTIGVTSSALKDFKRAVEGFQAALVTNPADALIRYQLGVSYMQLDPPQYMDGFWSLARAINLKVSGEAQVRSYLKNKLVAYQGGRVQCDKEIDAELNELLALAAAGPDLPADYTIPTSAEIEAVQKDINILTMLKGLKEGGKTAKLTWLASCGLEYPEVFGKVLSAADNGSGIVVQAFTDEDPAKVEAATEANLEVHVVEQPEAARLKKDGPLRFSGKVSRYTPEPFMVYFEKGKVNAEDIPAEEAAATKKATPKKAPPAKKRPPAKKQ